MRIENLCTTYNISLLSRRWVCLLIEEMALSGKLNGGKLNRHFYTLNQLAKLAEQ